MTLEDRIGHVGYALLCLGTFLVAERCVWGWPLYVLGDLVWLWVGWRLRLTSIWLWQLAFIVVALRGWWSWTH